MRWEMERELQGHPKWKQLNLGNGNGRGTASLKTRSYILYAALGVSSRNGMKEMRTLETVI